MTEVLCGAKAFDAHELLLHLIAERRGYYADEGLRVRLVDTTFVPDDRLPDRDFFQVACGAAYGSFRQGAPVTVAFAGVERPLFWLHGAPGVATVEALRGARVASYPAAAPPQWFLRVFLRRQGINPDHDVDLLHCRDDRMRLGLLGEGAVDAALVSSAVSTVALERRGFPSLALVGEHVPFVSTGVAAWGAGAHRDASMLDAVVRGHRRALQDVHSDLATASAVLEELLAESSEVVSATFEIIRRCFSTTGSVEAAELASWVGAVEAEVDAPHRSGEHLYDFARAV